MAEELVTLMTFEFANQAEMAKWVLEQEGIHAFVADANIMNTGPFVANAIGYAKLQVPAAQVEAAREVFARNPGFFKPRYLSLHADEETVEAANEVCLECGEPMPEEADKCSACGWSYGPPEEETNEEA